MLHHLQYTSVPLTQTRPHSTRVMSQFTDYMDHILHAPRRSTGRLASRSSTMRWAPELTKEGKTTSLSAIARKRASRLAALNGNSLTRAHVGESHLSKPYSVHADQFSLTILSLTRLTSQTLEHPVPTNPPPKPGPDLLHTRGSLHEVYHSKIAFGCGIPKLSNEGSVPASLQAYRHIGVLSLVLFACAVSIDRSLENPKSARRTCPKRSSNTFDALSWVHIRVISSRNDTICLHLV